MKKAIILIILMSIIQVVKGQVETKFFPERDAFDQFKLIKDHPKANMTIKLPSFDAQKLVDEAKLNDRGDLPFQFGKGFDTEITLSDGEWTNVGNGRLWSMEFQSNGAYSINFVFDQFFLSDSAKLYVINVDGTMLYGPVTSKQNTKNGYFLTDLIQGDDVTIHLYEPNSEKGKSKLTIKRIVHAYKNLFPELYGNLGGSDTCNNDIACFPAWDDESDAVALVLLSDGSEMCSGSLLMTANQSFRPYFLSAFHCIDVSRNGSLSTTEISNAENWMFKFQYKMTTCGGSMATMGITYNGATFRAAWDPSDFALLEMDNSPVGDAQFTWLGWDRSGNIPSSGTSIHHPSGDVMKISFDSGQLNSNNVQLNWVGGTTSPTNTHWVVGLDNGTAEGGSSGSPLFDQNSRVIGQLHGGEDGCPPVTKFYGQFHRSWAGDSTNTTRLSNWLDACGTGAVTTNTARSPYISGSSAVCPSGTTFTVNYVPPGGTVRWACSTNISFDNQPGDSKVFTANGTNSGWIVARIVTTCNDTITLPTQVVWVGLYSSSNYPITGPSSAPCRQYVYYSIPTLVGVTSINWVWPSGWTYISGQGTTNLALQTGTTGSGGIVGAQATNACGTGSYATKYTSVTGICGYRLDVSPNPATGEATIELVSDSEEGLAGAVEWELDIYDSMQSLKEKKTDIKTAQTMINTSSWKDGVYIVRAKIGDEVITEKLVVKH